MRRRHRGTDGGARGGLCTSNKSAGVLGGRERRRALFQTSPLIYLKLESCRANDGATTILRLPLPSRRRAILRSNSSACYLYLSNSGAHIRRDDFKRKLDVKKNSAFHPRYLAQSQLNETAKSAGKTRLTFVHHARAGAIEFIISLRISGDCATTSNYELW